MCHKEKEWWNTCRKMERPKNISLGRNRAFGLILEVLDDHNDDDDDDDDDDESYWLCAIFKTFRKF
jgi:hypothetical protein